MWLATAACIVELERCTMVFVAPENRKSAQRPRLVLLQSHHPEIGSQDMLPCLNSRNQGIVKIVLIDHYLRKCQVLFALCHVS